MLTKELREGNGLPRCRRVKLIRWSEHNYYVATAVWVQRVAAIHITKFFLLHDLQNNLFTRVGRVSQVLKGVNNGSPNLFISCPRRQSGVYIDLRRATCPTCFCQVCGRRG